MPENLSATTLRHSLRTLLNHIVGYSEMCLEESDPIIEGRMRALIAEAREVERFLHTFQPGDDRISEDGLQGLKTSLEPRVARMLAAIDSVSGNGTSACSGDLSKIRFAVERLGDFSLPTLSGSLSSAVQADSEGEAGRILVADDSADNRDILRRLLEREGYGVTTADNGQRALELLHAGTYDLVLLDVLMPVMDGIDVLRHVSADSRLRRTPVVMISALGETNNVARCVQMGAEDYLMKPFDPVLLSARVGASLEKKRLRDEERSRAEELQRLLDQLRRTQDQLLVQEKLASLGALTAGIAHEIRNPLNFISNFASSAKDIVQEMRPLLGGANEAVAALLTQLEQYVEKIDEHGRRADRIVRSMLMHSRGKPGEVEAVDLKSLLTDLVNLVWHAQRARDRSFNARIDSAFDPETGLIQAVPQEISRVFLNILNNAMDAVEDRKKSAADGYQPEVIVATRNLGAGVEIRVKDNGAGIAAEVLPKIFDPFFTTKPAGAGTGLGLSLSHDIIVRGHHGTIRAESNIGQGAEFIVTLPRSL